MSRINSMLPDGIAEEFELIIKECETRFPLFRFGGDPFDTAAVVIIWLVREVVKLRAHIAVR